MLMTAKFQKLPRSIQDLVKHGIKLTQPSKVILFGSRARGDCCESSDYDIAFKNLSHPEKWVEFLVDYDEEPLTLHKVDLLKYEDASAQYRNNIDTDGVVLYAA